MKIDVQVMVGGNVIITFDRVDVELTREEAEELKLLFEDAFERGERELLLIEVSKGM
jgi:DNA-binding response OmpR family regulator